MSSPLFSPITHYKDAPVVALATEFVSATPPRGTWPTQFGGGARISRIDEPLLQDTWRVRWQVELGDAERPRGLVLGEGRILVNGSERRGVWLLDGTPVGFFKRNPGAAFLDAEGKHFLCADSGGIATYSLDGVREALLPLSLATFATVREVLAGPSALVFVSNQKPPQASALLLAECMRLVDYGYRENGLLYGVEPVAGVMREGEHEIAATASDTGPVLATSDGVCFLDWHLSIRHEWPLSTIPLAVSVDAAGRALLVSDDYGELKFRVLPPHPTDPEREPLVELTLPSECRGAIPPLVTQNGQIYVCSEHALLALAPTGQLSWQQARSSLAPPVLTQNGLLLMADDQLYAVVSDGTRVPLWRPPHRIRTEAILADGIIYVATDSELFALEPAHAATEG
ncbi:MAG TPA: hypothetical protein VFQ35_01320 [Polyangiaceae bacterium]|nr:hypothetical protein [Polyangiaceae bacterium]